MIKFFDKFRKFSKPEKRMVPVKRGVARRLRKFVLLVALVSILSGSTMVANNKPAEGFAFFCWCWGIACEPFDVIIAPIFYAVWQAIWDPIIQENIEDHINSEENWIVEDFFEDFFVKGLAELTEFLSASGLYQVEVFGTLLDAKNHLEAQRLFWQFQAEAHTDYHPSDDFCSIGTMTRSLAASESRALYNRLVMSKRSLARQLGNINALGAGSVADDKEARWRKFVNTYCDPKDNNWNAAIGGSVKGTGLDLACDHDGAGPGTARGATNPERVNRDIDYTRLIETPRTLEINFADATGSPPVPQDEEDVLAMSKNLYGNNIFPRISASKINKNPGARNLYLALRSVAAKRSVAENTFNAIVSMKSGGTGSGATSSPPQQVRQYMASLLKDIMPTGTSDAEIYSMIGENPSYYAQLELLSKRIYQNQDFYANLYDTPANIKRKSVAMKAIGLMMDRALYESELRQEMLMSVLLSTELRSLFREADKDLNKERD